MGKLIGLSNGPALIVAVLTLSTRLGDVSSSLVHTKRVHGLTGRRYTHFTQKTAWQREHNQVLTNSTDDDDDLQEVKEAQAAAAAIEGAEDKDEKEKDEKEKDEKEKDEKEKDDEGTKEGGSED